MRHHLFVSYARTPDALLAREVERLLESFHDTMRDVPGASALEPLRICLDGSDFSMPPPDERDPAGADDVLGIVFRHLAQCRELLVLCSTGAARSTWIDREVRWFVEHRGAQFIRVGLTEGDRPWAEPQLYYPDALQELDLPRKIFYDLRGYDRRRSRNWTQVAEFSREMVRLAADLYGKPAGELYPTWLERELSRARTQSLGLVGSSRFETLAGDPGRALLVAFEAHELHPSPETEAALRDAYRVTRLHHENRREAALMTGSGPQHLAGRWKQGQLFSRSSPDGRYRLMVTERGADGANPPGEVYLINNETERTVRLKPPEGAGGRVECVTFDRESQHVLVSRYFHLLVYNLLGVLVGRYWMEQYTKSPVHLVAGLFDGRYVIAGETKGGLWLVVPGEDRAQTVKQTIEVFREFHGDAAVGVDIAPDGSAAVVVTESGRAVLVRAVDDGAMETRELPGSGHRYGGFPLGSTRSVCLAGDRGQVRILDPANREAVMVSGELGTPLDWVSASPDGRRLLAVGDGDPLFVLDSETGELLRTLNPAEDVDRVSVRRGP